MKKLLILLTLALLPAALFLLPAFAAAPSIPPARPATQVEVDAGTISNKFVSPLTLAGYSLAQSTGSISAATATNISAYQSLLATNKLSNDLRTNATFWTDGTAPFLRIDSTGDTLLDYGNAVFQGTADGLYSAAGIASGLGFEGNGESITNLDGANIQASTINSNKLDAATLALLGTGSGTQTNISAAAVTNAGTLIWSNVAAVVLYPTNSGTDGQIVSLTGNKTKWIDDATAAGGLATVATNALLYTTNVNARYDTNTIRISTGDQTNPDAWFDTIGSAGSVTPHFSVGGATAWWDFNLPVTNADVVHFSSVVVIDPDNMVYGAGTLALPALTGTTATYSGLATMNASATIANGATSSGVLKIMEDTDAGSNFASFQVPSLAANTVYTLPTTDGDASQFLQTDGSGGLTWATGGTGQTNVTDTAAYTSQVNSNLTVKGWAVVQGNQTNASIVVDTFVVNTNWDASLATNMTGTEIRSGTVADARIASTLTRDTEWDTIAEIVTATGSDIVTNTRTATLDIKNTITSYGHSVYTNLFTVNSAIGMGGTNWDISLGAVTGGITGIIGTAGTTKQYAELTVLSTGDTVFTNPAAFYASDGADSRTLTNGNLTTISIVWKPGLYTNLIFSWSK